MHSLMSTAMLLFAALILISCACDDDNDDGNFTPALNTEVKPAISAGYYHSLALKKDGTVWVWGDNEYWQLGDRDLIYSPSPVQANSLVGVIAIAAGRYHSLALKSDGTVWAWGDNSYGQLGDGTTTSSYIPVQVANLTGVIAIAAGFDHCLALTNNGEVKAWGINAYGQLGNGTFGSSSIPVDVSGLNSGVISISAGLAHSLAITNGGGVKAWGSNDFGQLGDGTAKNSATPVDVNGLTSGVIAIAAGTAHSLALNSEGTVWAWGRNHYGQLGDTTTTDRSSPVQVTSLTGITAISAGFAHSLALTNVGGVKAWGNNGLGQLGDGSMMNSPTPVDVSGLTSGVTVISAGLAHSLALKSNCTGWAWGRNQYGQLGDGTITDRSTPVEVTGQMGIRARVAESGNSLP